MNFGYFCKKIRQAIGETGALALIALIYFALAQLGLATAGVIGNSSPVWPAAGFAVFAVLKCGYRALLGVILGVIISQRYLGIDWPSTIGNFLAAATETYAAAWVLKRAWQSRSGQNHFQSEILPLISASFIGAIPGTLIGVGSFTATGLIPVSAWEGALLTWWMGDALGILVFLPLLLAISDRENQISSAKSASWRLAAFAAVIVTAALVFRQPSGALLFLLFPFTLLLSLRASLVELRFTTVAVSLIGIVITAFGYGPFRGGTTSQNLLFLQLFLGSFALTSLALESFRRVVVSRLAAGVLLSGWLVSALLYSSVHTLEIARDDRYISELVESASNSVRNRLNAYEDALRGAASLYTIKPQMTREEWRDYVAALRLVEKYPGVSGMGMIFPVKHRDLASFEKTARIDGAAGFEVRAIPQNPWSNPTDPEHLHYVIKYIEPLSSNFQAVGRDVGSEIERRQGAELAITTGLPTVSGRIHLVQDKLSRPGFLYFMPIYKKGMSLETPQERRAAFQAFIYAPFVTESLLRGVLGGMSAEIQVAAFEGADLTPDSLLFESSKGVGTSGQFDTTASIDFGLSQFTLAWKRGPDFTSARNSTAAWVGVLCVLITLLLASLIVSLETMGDQAAAIAARQTKLLNETQERFELALRGSSDGIWDWNILTNEVYFSPRWLEQLGFSEGELAAKFETFDSSLHPDDRQRVYDAVQKHLVHREPYSIEMRMKKKNGEWCWILGRGQAVWDANGQPTRMSGSHTDINERKRVELEFLRAKEEALAGTRAKSDFLANMSHEIRTPMNSIVGMADLLLETPLNDEQTKYVGVLRRAGAHLLSVINDILDLSKIEAGSLVIDEIDFDLAEVVKRTMEIVGPKAYEREIQIQTSIDPKIQMSLRGDPARLQQILLNLLSNAVKFTPPAGRIELRVDQDPASTEPTAILMSVRDNGIGIPSEKIGRLFDRFVQADNSITRKFGGTGLGLTITKQLVERMGGKISVESKEGEGSCFRFTLRFKAADKITGAPKPGKSSLSKFIPQLSGKIRVLVVEDAEDNRFLVGAFLKPHPEIHLEFAENGELAVEKAKTSNFDVIFMDMQMPVMDGMTATRLIREWEKDNGKNRTPIIALTANAFKSEEGRSLEAGCDLNISKPVKKATLFKVFVEFVPDKVRAA